MTITWWSFAKYLAFGLSLFICYALYQSNASLRLDKDRLTKELTVANANITLQQELTKDALGVKEVEQKASQTVIKYVDRVDRVIVKDSPTIAEDANKLWKEALNDA